MTATAPARTPVERIVGARIRVLRAATRGGVAMSFAPLAHRSMVLVELHGESGAVGYGESWVNFPAWAPAERVATLRDGVLPLVLDTPGTVQETQPRLTQRLDPLGRQWGAPGPIRQAISAVDVALWDLAGKAAGESVAALAGGAVRTTIPTYASSLGPTNVVADAQDCLAAGHTAVKVKLGFGRAADQQALNDARTTLGPGATLYADANQAWTVDEAAAMVPVLRDFGVGWLEEPIRGDRLADLEELHSRTGITIATGENVYGLATFEALAASPAVAILQPDITKAGGLTEALAVGRLAAAAGKQVWPHLYGGALGFAATLQLAAADATVQRVEYDVRHNPLRDPLLTAPPVPRAGVVTIPAAPGLGVALDRHAVQEYTEDAQLVGNVSDS